MTCIKCQHGTAKRLVYYGTRRIQRFGLQSHFSEPQRYISTEKATQIINLGWTPGLRQPVKLQITVR